MAVKTITHYSFYSPGAGSDGRSLKDQGRVRIQIVLLPSSVNESSPSTLRFCGRLSSVSFCCSLWSFLSCFCFQLRQPPKTILPNPNQWCSQPNYAADSTCGVIEQIIGFTSHLNLESPRVRTVSLQIQPTWPCYPCSQCLRNPC